jgi:hypothetical protein
MLSSVLLTAVCTGCHSWQVQPGSPEQLIQVQQPTVVQVRESDGRRIVLKAPEIVGDTLVGFQSGGPTRVPLAAVDQVAVRRFSPGKTTLVVLAVPAGLLGIALIGCSVSDCGY